MKYSATSNKSKIHTRKIKNSEVKRFALLVKPRGATELDDWQYWPVKGKRGDLRATNVLIPKYLGKSWEIAILKNIQNGIRKKVWHWLEGEMSPSQYDKWKDDRRAKKKEDRHLLKLSIIHHDAFAQKLRLEGKPSKKVVKSLDIDPQNGSIGLDVALRSLRQFLTTYKHRKEVKKAFVWNMPTNKNEQNKILADFDFCFTISFKDKEFEKIIKQSVQYDQSEFGVPNYELYGM